MRLTDFLRTAVLLFSAAATALAMVAVVGASADDDVVLLYVAVVWWALAGGAGLYLGRRAETSRGIGHLLAGARSTPALPELEPGRVVIYRLWPVGAFTVVSGALAFLLPQVPAIGCGYALIVSLAWRKQERAVQAIEERDGARFYVERGSPIGPTRLVRTPGLRKVEPPSFERATQAAASSPATSSSSPFPITESYRKAAATPPTTGPTR